MPTWRSCNAAACNSSNLHSDLPLFDHGDYTKALAARAAGCFAGSNSCCLLSLGDPDQTVTPMKEKTEVDAQTPMKEKTEVDGQAMKTVTPMKEKTEVDGQASGSSDESNCCLQLLLAVCVYTMTPTSDDDTSDDDTGTASPPDSSCKYEIVAAVVAHGLVGMPARRGRFCPSTGSKIGV